MTIYIIITAKKQIILLGFNLWLEIRSNIWEMRFHLGPVLYSWTRQNVKYRFINKLNKFKQNKAWYNFLYYMSLPTFTGSKVIPPCMCSQCIFPKYIWVWEMALTCIQCYCSVVRHRCMLGLFRKYHVWRSSLMLKSIARLNSGNLGIFNPDEFNSNLNSSMKIALKIITAKRWIQWCSINMWSLHSSVLWIW